MLANVDGTAMVSSYVAPLVARTKISNAVEKEDVGYAGIRRLSSIEFGTL